MPREFENTWRYKGTFTWPNASNHQPHQTTGLTFPPGNELASGCAISPLPTTHTDDQKTLPEPFNSDTTAINTKRVDTDSYTGVKQPLSAMKPKKPKRKVTDIVAAAPATLIHPGWQDLTQLDWFEKLTAPVKSKVATLATLAEETQIALNGAVSVYVSLVKFVKTSSLEPQLVKATLLARGYNEARISEIKKVAEAPDDVLNDLETRAIGFKAAVRKARELAGINNPDARAKKQLHGAIARLAKVARTFNWTKHEEHEGPWRITIELLELPEEDAEEPHVHTGTD